MTALRPEIARRFAEAVPYFPSSPLYQRLAAGTAKDPDLLRLTAEARPGQHEAFLLFGAVHYLLARQPGDPLSRYYEDLTPICNTGDPFPEFRRFCLDRSIEISGLVRDRLVQTNDPKRSSLLVLGLTAALGDSRHPIAVLEIGASAGLNLIFDRYTFDIGRAGSFGVPDSPVVIRCQAIGPNLPPLPKAFPTVAWRAGIDLNPIDVRDPDAVAWLRAPITPEDRERTGMLLAACAMARANPPRIVEGDAPAMLGIVAAQIPPDLPMCIFHSGVLFHIPPDDRHLLTSAIVEVAAGREVHWLSLETPGSLHHPARSVDEGMVLGLTSFSGGSRIDRVLAFSDGPSHRVEWCV